VTFKERLKEILMNPKFANMGNSLNYTFSLDVKESGEYFISVKPIGSSKSDERLYRVDHNTLVLIKDSVHGT